MLFVGDDWAEDHHDVEIVDEGGQVLARRRLPEGLEGVTRLHTLIAEHLPAEWADLEAADAAAMVKVGIETDRGPWVAALVTAGYEVFAINPMSVARYRERHSTSGAKSDSADAHLLAEIVRLDRAHHRPVAGDSDQAEAIKLTARTHQSLIWDRTRHVLRLRSALRDFFPAALKAFPDLDAADALELLRRAPDPDQAARLTASRIGAALRRAHRRDLDAKTAQLREILGADELRQPPMMQSAYAAIVTSEVAIIEALNTQIDHLGAVVEAHFGQHPDAEIYASQPGLGVILAARVLGEFGDDQHRYVDAKARKSYAGTAPITRASGTKKIVLARYARNRRLGDALQQWAFCSLRGFTRRTRLLPTTPRPKDRPPSRPATARQPPRRHPPRLPQDAHPLRRKHRMGTPHACRRLTSKNLGCLPRTGERSRTAEVAGARIAGEADAPPPRAVSPLADDSEVDGGQDDEFLWRCAAHTP